MTEPEKKEQAKREKEIGTFSKIVCDGCGACCGCFAKRGWENLYDYILRREEEVRRETIKNFVETTIRCLKDDVVMQHAIKVIAHCKFGVEVGE